MDKALEDKITETNSQLAAMLSDMKRALTGESEFGVEQVKALSALTAPMGPVMERAEELRSRHPEMAGPLEAYKSLLRELQLTAERVRMMLVAKRSQMDAGRVQLHAVTLWANALGRTR